MVKGLKMLFEEGKEERTRVTRENIALLMLGKSYSEKEIIDISQLTKEELDKLKKQL